MTELIEEKYDCSICLELIGINNFTRTRCGHTFHLECLLKLAVSEAHNRNKCPNCREQLVQSIPIPFAPPSLADSPVTNNSSIFTENGTIIMFDNNSIRTAVSNWLLNPVEAEQLYGHINNWNVSRVTNMKELFQGASCFNQPIGNWDVSSVVSMECMFRGASSFNQFIGNWDVSRVLYMGFMFRGASSFDQPIGQWDVSSVVSMEGTFGNSSFNQPIDEWDVGSVLDMGFMFCDASSFDQPIGQWNVSNVTVMTCMFENSSFNQPIGNWDVSNVTDMEDMFCDASSFNQSINW